MESRGQWSGKLGFILAAAGSAVGLGNLWKFPYMAHEHHGGAFVLIYVLAVVLVGVPIMMAEVLMGRRAQRNPVGTFRTLAEGLPGGRLWMGVGFLGVTAGFVILSYYSVIAGWTLHYIWLALKGQLADLARQSAAALETVATPAAGAEPPLTPIESSFGAFLTNATKQICFHLAFMALTVGSVYFGVKGGIERVARVLMPALFGMLVLLFIIATQMSGFGQALSALFVPDFSTVSAGTVLAALGQAFFSLSLGMGAMLTYGSYMQRSTSIPRSVVQICTLDSIIGIVAALIMFTIIASSEHMQVRQSATILFTTLPAMLVKLPGGDLFNAVFFVLVAFAALTSTISLMEVVSSYAIDELKWPRKRATVVMGAAIAAMGVLNALSLDADSALGRFNPLGVAEGLFPTLDYLSANWFLPVGGFLIAIFVGWFLDRRLVRGELEAGHGPMRTLPQLFVVLRFVAPLAVGAIIFSVIFLGAEYQ